MSDDVNAQTARIWLIQQLRTALNALYDPAVLGHCQLVRLFQIDQRRDRVFALRRILTEAIESLRPKGDEPPDSRLWRVYQILRSRYIEQSPQPVVAADLNLSIRQLQREESAAREVLADYLWAAQNLSARSSELERMSAVSDEQAEASLAEAHTTQEPPTLDQELEWLGRSAPIVAVDVEDVINKTLDTIRPLVEHGSVAVEYVTQKPSLRLNLQAAVLRQALINVASAAVGYVPGGRVYIDAQAGPQQLAVEVHAVQVAGLTADRQLAANEGLQIAGEMLRLSGGALLILPVSDPEIFAARIVLPISQPVNVLVIDDNADTLQLIRRYLSGSHYQFVGAQDARQALALAEETSPHVIVLDVMMPEQDGWMLLGQFREHPRTRGIPIVICTVIPQEQLALSLGAAQFLRKPVSREALLGALDRQLGQLQTGLD